MRKILFGLLCCASITFLSAQSSPGLQCADLAANLSRGMETGNVLKLQNFLYAKGLLKATPNGYYGPGTFAAVAQYQRMNRLLPVGIAGPMTRAAIRKESCTVTLPPAQALAQAFQAYAAAASTTSATTSAQASTTPAVTLPSRPVIDSIDLVTLFENGETDWTFNMYGSNFQKGQANGVLLYNTSNRKTYNIGAFASPDGKTITFPANLTSTSYRCGVDCHERLTPGRYEVTVVVFGAAPSDPKFIEVKPFTLSAQTAAMQGAIPAQSSNQRFGSLTFSTPESVRVDSITLVTSSSTISGSGITSTTIKNELTGSAFSAGVVTSSYQSLVYGAYVSTNNTKAGDVWSSFSVEIYDYIGKKKTKFNSAPFLVTVAGVI